MGTNINKANQCLAISMSSMPYQSALTYQEEFQKKIYEFILIQLLQVKSANEIKVDFLKPLIGLFILWYLFLKGPKKEWRINKLKKFRYKYAEGGMKFPDDKSNIIMILKKY